MKTTTDHEVLNALESVKGCLTNSVSSKLMVTASRDGPVQIDLIGHFLINLLLLPVRLSWDLLVIVGAIWLEVIWVGFVFGSVVGVVLLLIFAPGWFVAPLALMSLVVNPWPEHLNRNAG